MKLVTIKCQYVNPDGSLGDAFEVEIDEDDVEVMYAPATPTDDEAEMLAGLDAVLDNWE